MTVKEYLEENKYIFDNGLPFQLMDVLTNRMVAHYGGGYIQFMEDNHNSELKDARFIYEDFGNEENCIVFYCMREIDAYSQHDLERLRKDDKRIIELTSEEIDCFNAYIEDAKMDVAFGNSDWRSIYHKIVGDRVSEYAKEKMDRYFAYED